MPIGCVLLLNSRGDILCSRNYRDHYQVRTVGEAFRTQIIATKLADRSPVRTISNITFMHMRHENIWFVTVTKQNANVALCFQFMSECMKIFRMYFNGLNEDIVRDNIVTILELLDEVLDYGYPQITDTDILKLYITSAGMKAESIAKAKEGQGSLTDKLTGIVSWRKDGIKHRKNEVFIDVIEDVNVLIAQNGTVLQRDVSGRIMMKSFLSGMPDCKFGLNDRMMLQAEAHKSSRYAHIDLEDVTFHQCVRMGKYEASKHRDISFIPPDGEFQLMKYRTSDNVSPPFKILYNQTTRRGGDRDDDDGKGSYVKTFSKTRMEISFRVKAEFSSRLFGTKVVVKVPCPKNTANVKVTVGAGKAKYEPEHGAIIWNVRRFPGGSEVNCNAEVQLISSTSEGKQWSKPPISMDFQVPMLAASGLHVRFLKVHESKLNYQAVKWVRYITKAGQYECRI
eukprot:TRINITY_DN50193_c0_g1_i1.p2 TRINITY_DN50193_c0_g1~~TRINITY_DN50193_c0_g1_i1.p2  ORF type:complete len:453 (+),score=159.41 TRINITY_DN50193_c0_g1_i1:94-1452(+)